MIPPLALVEHPAIPHYELRVVVRADGRTFVLKMASADRDELLAHWARIEKKLSPLPVAWDYGIRTVTPC